MSSQPIPAPPGHGQDRTAYQDDQSSYMPPPPSPAVQGYPLLYHQTQDKHVSPPPPSPSAYYYQDTTTASTATIPPITQQLPAAPSGGGGGGGSSPGYYDARAQGYGYGYGGGGGGGRGGGGTWGFQDSNAGLYNNNNNNDDGYVAAFAEVEVRRTFVRRVFSLVTIMMLCNLAVSAAFLFVPEVKAWVAANPWTLWVAFLGFFGLMLAVWIPPSMMRALTCSPTLRLSPPHNYFALFGFTVFLSFFTAVIVARYDTLTVLIAVGIVSVLVLALTAFASQTRIDFTVMHSALFTLLIGLIIMGVLSLFFYSDFLRIIYATLGAVIFSAYLCYDVQLLMGGKTYALGPEEHVLGAVVIFLDIINLFLMILQLVGLGRGR